MAPSMHILYIHKYKIQFSQIKDTKLFAHLTLV